MHLTPAALLLAFSIPTALATVHTACYNYFLQKDGCVFSAADNKNRCPADAKKAQGVVPQFQLSGTAHTKRDEKPSLARRLDTTEKSFPVLGGNGLCGSYDTNADDGVCLWSGDSRTGANQNTAGWLNGAQTLNCGKRVYIQRRGRPETAVYAKVRDGCGLNTFDASVGCFQLALTNKTFNALLPTQQERDQQGILDLSWDFDNLHGQSPEQGPV